MTIHSTLHVITPATDFSLMSLEDFKTALRITGTQDDVFLQGVIDRASDEIATLCNRVFAKEKVTEIFRNIPEFGIHLWLARWPVRDEEIESVLINDTT